MKYLGSLSVEIWTRSSKPGEWEYVCTGGLYDYCADNGLSERFYTDAWKAVSRGGSYEVDGETLLKPVVSPRRYRARKR